jgi:serine/threonine protein kinase
VIVPATREGKPLSELLHDEQLTPEEILVVLVRAMDRVAAAHALGVLHRNLKPSNIFVCVGRSGLYDDPRVLDLGHAATVGALDSSHTQTSAALGTPYYMPIEQLEGQLDLDARVDVYAMGVMLYEALSGELPHHADDAAALALELKHTPPVPLGVRRPDLPPALTDVVMRALASEPEQRYPSMRALVHAILPFVPRDAGLTVLEPEASKLSDRGSRATQARASILGSRAEQPQASPPPTIHEPVDPDDLLHAPSSVRLAAPRLPADLMPSAPPGEAQASLAPHRTSLRARVLGALGALSVTAAALAGARLISWSRTESSSEREPAGVPGAPRAASSPARAAGNAEPRMSSDAGHLMPALAMQPHLTIVVTSSLTVIDAGGPAPMERATSVTSGEAATRDAPQQ